MANNECIEKIHVDVDMSFNQIANFQQIASDRVAKNAEILDMLNKVMEQSGIMRIDACDAIRQAITYTEAEEKSWGVLALQLNDIATRYVGERRNKKRN